MDIAELLPDAAAEGWTGDLMDSVIVCPCGYAIEHDGRCPDGCVSPLLTGGLI